MNAKLDFSQSLLLAMERALADQDPKIFVAAALALRAWYRHEALALKPEMVVQANNTVFEVYGGSRIARSPDGSVQFYMGNTRSPAYAGYQEMSTVGKWLSTQARNAVQAEFLARARALVARYCPAAQADPMDSLLTSLNDYIKSHLNVPWWRRKSSHADDSRVLGKLLWDSGLLDREVFGMAVRVGGFRFTLELYNQCAVNRTELQARIAEAPHMAPWLYGADLGSTLQVHQTVWQDMKLRFMGLGGTQQGWKWLCSQGANWFRYLSLNQTHVLMVNRLAALQIGRIPYHRGLMGALLYKQDTRFFDVLKAAVIANRKRKLKVADFQDYVLIFDYLGSVPSAATKGSTWASLMRKQRVWHMEQVRLEVERRKESGACYGWAPMVQSIVQDDFEAISLNDSDALWEEGGVMHHCVGGYDSSCYRNMSRIYSIRRAGERVATLEIRLVGNKWTIGQLYGVGNSRITDKAVIKLSKRVLMAFTRGAKLNLADNKVIRQPKKAPSVARRPAPQPVAQHEMDAEIPF